MKLDKKQIATFQEKILDWFAENKRDLPWRHSRDPYSILVSEVMLQQTQVSRVIPKFEAWMKKFPTVEKLAQASTRDVLLLWSGLGYNRRALYLQKVAVVISSKARNPREISYAVRDDKFWYWPQTEEELTKLPGIGEYTAKALLCFAFNQQIAVVDTNVRKVILVHFKNVIPDLIGDPGLDSRFRGNDKEGRVIQKLADQLLPKDRAYEWNQALMDYSSAVLKKEKIAIPKQSHFKTSNRFYRGQVIRMLLKGRETIDTAFKKLENNGISKEKFGEIVKQMEKEGLIDVYGTVLAIHENISDQVLLNV